MAEVGQDPALSPDAAGRLRRFAASRRFQLGRPRDLALAAGRLLFLRSLAADDPVTGLWSLSLVTGEERLLADPRELLAGRPEEVPAAELRRRERMRESARGIVAYSTGTDGRLAAFALSGRLFVCDVAAGATREISVTGACVDPQLSPDGTAVAYLAGRALRVTRLDGRPVLDLADEDPEVSFGAAEFGAAEEMDRHHGYWWSPDGTTLLAARVSEHGVASWWLGDPADAVAEPYRQRYPFAGTPNPEVRLLLVALDGSRTDVDLPTAELPYVHHVRWDGAGDPLVTLHARDHGRAEVRAVDPGTGATRVVHADSDPAWLELIPGTPRWLAGGGLLVSASSADTHRIVIDGTPLTPPGLQLLSVAGQAGQRIIFCATDEPAERHVYALDPRDQTTEKLTAEPGVHSATILGDLLAISSETLEDDGLTVGVVGPGAAGEVAPRLRPSGRQPRRIPGILRTLASPAGRCSDRTSGSAGLSSTPLPPVRDPRPLDLDAGHVGIRGWSFGGYFAALAVLRAARRVRRRDRRRPGDRLALVRHRGHGAVPGPSRPAPGGLRGQLAVPARRRPHPAAAVRARARRRQRSPAALAAAGPGAARGRPGARGTAPARRYPHGLAAGGHRAAARRERALLPPLACP